MFEDPEADDDDKKCVCPKGMRVDATGEMCEIECVDHCKKCANALPLIDDPADTHDDVVGKCMLCDGEMDFF
jgi:hypothetical protein